MAWNADAAPADGWNGASATMNTYDDGFNPAAPENYGGAVDDGFGGTGEYGAEGDQGGDGNCRNCGQEGHFARECPEPRQFTGECFNCGKIGHAKTDCTEPRVFTGTCKICEQQGHRAAECPDKPPPICRNCGNEGHEAFGCEEKKKISLDHIADKIPAEAWAAVKKANDEREVAEFKEAIQVLAKALPELTYCDLEKEFRERGFNVYLIGMEKEILPTQTIVDLQGNIGRKFAVGYYLSDQPARKSMKSRWPASTDDNMERLANAGLAMDSGIIQCRTCDELGHTSKQCKQEKTVVEQVEVKCFLCGEVGHRVRDCKEERPSNKPRECKTCGSTEHLARECPEKPVRTCRNCGSEDHVAKECDQPRPCRNCDQHGHTSRDCPAPKDWSRVTCNNCGEKGHTVRRCKEPIKEELAVKNDDGGVGGGIENFGIGDGVEHPDMAAGGNDWGHNNGNTDQSFSVAPVAASGGW